MKSRRLRVKTLFEATTYLRNVSLIYLIFTERSGSGGDGQPFHY